MGKNHPGTTSTETQKEIKMKKMGSLTFEEEVIIYADPEEEAEEDFASCDERTSALIEELEEIRSTFPSKSIADSQQIEVVIDELDVVADEITCRLDDIEDEKMSLDEWETTTSGIRRQYRMARNLCSAFSRSHENGVRLVKVLPQHQDFSLRHVPLSDTLIFCYLSGAKLLSPFNSATDTQKWLLSSYAGLDVFWWLAFAGGGEPSCQMAGHRVVHPKVNSQNPNIAAMIYLWPMVFNNTLSKELFRDLFGFDGKNADIDKYVALIDPNGTRATDPNKVSASASASDSESFVTIRPRKKQ